MTSPISYFILPGYGNSGEDHWQSYFEKTLPNCSRIEQKSWEEPLCEDWVEAIEQALQKVSHENIVLISHSLGGIALAHWADRFPRKILGAMIVAPPDIENPYMDLGLQSFTPIPLQKFPFRSIVVASTDDHWATVDRSTYFANSWGSELRFIENAGHINANSGFGSWDEGMAMLEGFLRLL